MSLKMPGRGQDVDMRSLQRWIYRIDPNRVNEYGQVMTAEETAAAEKLKAEASKKDR